jgi:MotA/TolQ/ExbB proton channel family
MQEMTDPVVQQSFLTWFLASLGLKYGVMLAVSGFVAFFLSTIVAIRGKEAAAVGALVLIVPLPFLVGLFGALEGSISSFAVMATSDVQVKASALAEGISMALAVPLAGLLLMVPAYLVGSLGLFFRSLSRNAGQA